MKLTAKAVAALMLPDGKSDAIYFDDDLPGFGYRLRQSGEKVGRTWCAQYRHAGQTRRITLGSASVLTSEQARSEAKRILAQAALRQDPASERKRKASADRFTFSHLAEQYLAAKRPVVRGRTFVEAQRYLQSSAYFGPLFSVPVDSITRRDVAARVLIITQKNGQVAAARARTALSAMFTWAMENGLAETNPTIGSAKPKAPPSRERTLSNEELVAVWRAAGDDDFGRIVKLLITTGQRRTEVGGIAWTEVDEHGTWAIPASRTKNGREHSLPLSSLALEVIRSVPQVVGRDLLFGARTERGFTSWAEHKKVLDKRLAEQVKPWTLHDLRRTAATRMCDIGIEPFVVEQILNHQSGTRRGASGVGGVYNKSKYAHAVKNAVAVWDRYIGLITDRDLYTAHQAFLATGDEQAREKASQAFHDAIAAGGGHWMDYRRAIVEGGKRKVILMRSAGGDN
jgi:integrase